MPREPVRRRVAIHERPALPAVMEAVRSLLSLVPGLEVVEVPPNRPCIRVDHPDGLRDPEHYFVRLHTACPRAWITAEKILERLPCDVLVVKSPDFAAALPF